MQHPLPLPWTRIVPALAVALAACSSSPSAHSPAATTAAADASAPRSLESGWIAPKYPAAPREDVVDEYHGTKVADPYRWLEDPDAPRTVEWVQAENAVTRSYIEPVASRAKLVKRLTELWNYERYGRPPYERNGRFFLSRNDGLQNQNVIYVSESIDAAPRVLLDPNTLRADGTVALGGSSASDDGKYFAYALAEGGSDWNTWRVRDVDTGKDLDDVLRWVKFSGAAWLPDSSGFFYSRYDEPKGGDELRRTRSSTSAPTRRSGPSAATSARTGAGW
jgi:prolyl oligopeptidase